MAYSVILALGVPRRKEAVKMKKSPATASGRKAAIFSHLLGLSGPAIVMQESKITPT